MIDLHTHSRCSDGTEAPARVVELAAEAGCTAVALTDHDTFAGLGEARARAEGLGVELVAGCEVSCAFRGTDAHVLAYFVDDDDGPLGRELARLREDRVVRNRRVVERLVGLGVPLTYEEVVAEAAGEESVGRPHVAAVLVRRGAAASVPDAFDTWLAEGRPAYVRKARLHPGAVAAAAAASAGVVSLAHPLSLGLGPSELDGAVAELAAAGLTGLEARYAAYHPSERARLVALARRHGLVPTGGSDHHGAVTPDLAVGTGQGDLAVPGEVLEELRERRP